jgi:hypothetical protein
MIRTLRLIVAIALTSALALAGTINYTFAGLGTGTFAGTPFTNDAFTIALTANTSVVAGATLLQVLNASVSLTGFTQTFSTAAGELNFNPGPPPVGTIFPTCPEGGCGQIFYVTGGANSQVFVSVATDLANWNLVSSVGPDPAFLFNPDPSLVIPTTSGNVIITSISGATFAASAGVTLPILPGGPSSEPMFLFSAQPVGEVTGTISGSGAEDYYSFVWGGGAFNATASIPGSGTGASYLFSEGVNCSDGGSVTLNSSDSFSGTIAFANLAAGTYCIGIDANSGNDPAYAITFNTPLPAQTPEPTGFVLSSTGLALIGLLFLWRRLREHSGHVKPAA